MRTLLIVAVTACCLGLPPTAMSDDTSVVDAEVVTQLALTQTFAIGQVGFVGHISLGEQLYRRILGSPSAFRIFSELLGGALATTEARLYAACGVRHLAPAAFEESTRALRLAGSSASVLYTDILRREAVGGLLDRIARNGCGEPTQPQPTR